MSYDTKDEMQPHISSQETHHLLKIFPSEVWNIIAEKLDIQSLISLINSSLFFRELLLKKRVEYLFQPVLKILAPKLLQYYGISSETYKFSSHGYPEVKPLKTLILNLRLGCRSWNKSIQDLSSVINYEETCSLPPGKSEIINQLTSKCYSISSAKQSSAFLEKFSGSHSSTKSNPFLGRSLIIMGPTIGGSRGDAGDPQIFFSQIPQILQTFGHHIWSLYFQISSNFSSEQQLHSKTVELMNDLPNLKILIIIFQHCTFADHLVDNNISFLNLPHLKSLEFHDWPASSFNMFAQQNPQINKLIIFRHTNEYHYNLSPLINLEYLSVDLFSDYDQEVIIENPELQFMHLKKLKLHYRNIQNGSGDVQFVRWSAVFQMLSQKLGENEHFEELSLVLPKPESENEKLSVYEDSVNGRLCLKSLKNLCVTFHESIASIDFLLGISKTLKELKLRLDFDEASHMDTESMQTFVEELDKEDKSFEIEGHQDIVNFLGCKSKMMESNIWELMPELNKVEIQISSYVKLYERKCEEK